MKRIVAISLWFYVPFTAMSQNEYFPIGAEWNVYWYCTGWNSLQTRTVTGDTIINGQTFRKIEGNPEYILRSDSTKIYRWSEMNEYEFLIYDFNASVGDTMFNVAECEPVVVAEIDSISIGGQIRKVFTLYSENFNLWAPVVIEGIGNANTGLFGPMCNWFECGIPDLCYQQNDTSYTFEVWVEFIGMETSTELCPNTISVSELDDKRLEVYPNPSHTILKANIPSNATSVSIIDATGHVVFTENVFYPKQEWNLDGLANGLYVMRVVLENGIRISEMIVKQ